MKDNYSVVIFYSTSAAIRAESLAQKANLKIKLIPIPRHLSSDCGICLQFNNEDKQSIKEILKKTKLNMKIFIKYKFFQVGAYCG